MDNKGEMVDASMNLYAYRCNLQSGINRNILIDKKTFHLNQYQYGNL